MATESAPLSAIIAATAGIVGVLLGNSFVTIKEYVVNRSKRKKDASYLAIIVVSHLDRFVSGCANVAYDDGTDEFGRPAGRDGVYCEETTREPVLEVLGLDVEWRSLPLDLMYSILRIPDRQEQLNRRVRSCHEDDDLPDFGNYFRARRYAYAELGLEVAGLALKLRKHAGLPVEESGPGAGDRDHLLRDAMRAVTEERAIIKERTAEHRKRQDALTVQPAT